MLSNFLMAAAILSLLLAMFRRWPEARLRAYILSELVATTGIAAAAVEWPDANSRGYTLAYCLARSVDLFTAIWLSKPRLGTVLAGLFYAGIAATGVFYVSGRLDLNAGISLWQGAGFAIAALSTRLWRPVTVVSTTLGVLWALLALFFFSYAMYWQTSAMWEMSTYWNTAIFIAAFVILSLPPRLAEHSPPSSQPAEYRR